MSSKEIFAVQQKVISEEVLIEAGEDAMLLWDNLEFLGHIIKENDVSTASASPFVTVDLTGENLAFLDSEAPSLMEVVDELKALPTGLDNTQLLNGEPSKITINYCFTGTSVPLHIDKKNQIDKVSRIATLLGTGLFIVEPVPGEPDVQPAIVQTGDVHELYNGVVAGQLRPHRAENVGDSHRISMGIQVPALRII